MGKEQWISCEWVSGEVKEDKSSLWQKVADLICESVTYMLVVALAVGAAFVVFAILLIIAFVVQGGV